MQASETKASIEKLLQELGTSAKFQENKANDGSTMWVAEIFYQGIPVLMALGDNTGYLTIDGCLGSLPRETLVPLYRKLLVRNHTGVGHQFSIDDKTNKVHIVSNVATKYINQDFEPWFRDWFQGFFSAVHQYALPILRQFGIGSSD